MNASGKRLWVSLGNTRQATACWKGGRNSLLESAQEATLSSVAIIANKGQTKRGLKRMGNTQTQRSPGANLESPFSPGLEPVRGGLGSKAFGCFP
jgi:hypothetical protein